MTSSSTPKTNLSLVWERLVGASLRSKARLTGEQASRQTWAKKVYNFESVPEAFRPAALEIVQVEQNFPYAVLTPTFAGYRKVENEKLIFCLKHRLYILENGGQTVTSTSYELENIHRIEFGEILLKAWVQICGTDDRGIYSNTYLCFNSVTDFLFNPFIEVVRLSDEPLIPGNLQQEGEKFSLLNWRHFKFMNYARNSLLPGEQVAQYIFQPEMETVLVKLFRVTLLKRTLCLTHILIQTDRELILIQDDETSRRLKDGSRYGGIWNYVPLHHVRDLVIEGASDGLVQLTIELTAGNRLSLPYANERRPELEQFVQNIQKVLIH